MIRELFERFTRTKLHISILPLLCVYLWYQDTPPPLKAIAIAILPIMLYVFIEGIRDIKRIAIVGLVLAFLTPNLALSGDIAKTEGPNPQVIENVAPGPSLDVFCGINGLEIAQNGDSVAIPDSAECCPDLETCRSDIEALRKNPPDLPLHSLLMTLSWYRDLAPWARITIAGTLDAIILGGMIYLGTVSK